MKKAMFNKQYGLEDAVIEGKKTKTRRICKNQSNPIIEDAPWKVGETIAVARRYSDCGGWLFPYEEYGETAGWNNKMFVSAYLMPYQIKITDIRIERLQDIPEEDCLAEGIEEFYGNDKNRCKLYNYPYGDSPKLNPKEAFATLIDKISGKGTWESNPWVYAYEFELINPYILADGGDPDYEDLRQDYQLKELLDEMDNE